MARRLKPGEKIDPESFCDLESFTARLDKRGIEYEVHELTPVSTLFEGELHEENLPTHAIQYFDDRGQDTLVVTVGEGQSARLSVVLINGQSLAANDVLARIPVQVSGQAVRAMMKKAAEFGYPMTAVEAHFCLEEARYADGGMLP